MSSFINNCTSSGMPFPWVADQDRSGHHASTSRQQGASTTGNYESHGAVGLHQGIYARSAYTGCVSDMSSWLGTASFDPSFSMHGGGTWPGDQRFEEIHQGPPSGAPNGNANGYGTLVGTMAAAPILGQAFPVAQRALPDFPPCAPPFVDWTQVPGSWHPASSWACPVDTASYYRGHVSSTGFLGMGPEAPLFQPAPSSVPTGHTEGRRMPAGRLPPTTTMNSVQRSAHSDPAPVVLSAPRPCGERWDLSLNATTFRCMWTSGGTQCTALITGNRRSVTSHLRKEHEFACDDQTIACAWGECTASMQRRNIPRHVVACHFEIKVKCPQCGLALSRADASKKHRLACTGGRTSAAVEPAEEDDGQLGF